MKSLLRLSFFGVFSALWLTGCTSQEVVREALAKDPDILFDAMEKNPERFAGVLERVSYRAREIAMQKAQQEERARREEDWRNPKQPEIPADRAVLGKNDAPITIVAYSDFQCPYCQKGFETIEEVRQKYGDRVRFVMKHLPLDIHHMALPTAKYFEAIAMQSAAKAYKFHDEVFKNQSSLREGDKFLDATAKKVGANMRKLKTDLTSNKVMARIDADRAEAAKFGIRGTPGFIVEGITLPGAYPMSEFQEIIERKLSRGVASEPQS